MKFIRRMCGLPVLATANNDATARRSPWLYAVRWLWKERQPNELPSPPGNVATRRYWRTTWQAGSYSFIALAGHGTRFPQRRRGTLPPMAAAASQGIWWFTVLDRPGSSQPGGKVPGTYGVRRGRFPGKSPGFGVKTCIMQVNKTPLCLPGAATLTPPSWTLVSFISNGSIFLWLLLSQFASNGLESAVAALTLSASRNYDKPHCCSNTGTRLVSIMTAGMSWRP